MSLLGYNSLKDLSDLFMLKSIWKMCKTKGLKLLDEL